MLNRYENKNDCFKEAAFLITKNSLRTNVLSWKQIQMTRKQMHVFIIFIVLF
jgi:hypothetical protein